MIRKPCCFAISKAASKILANLIFLFFVLFPPLVLAQSAGSATLSLSPSSASFGKGCNFSVDVNLDTGGANTDGTDVILKFDRTRLTAVSVTPGTIYPDYPSNSPDNSTGTINISGLASISQPFNGSGKFATINFTANPGATTGLTQVTFDFDPNDKEKTTDSNVVESGTVRDILSAVQNGVYTINTSACSSTSSPAPSPTPAAGSTGGFASGGVTASGSGTIDDIVGGSPGMAMPTIILGIVGTVLIMIGVVGLSLL